MNIKYCIVHTIDSIGEKKVEVVNTLNT